MAWTKYVSYTFQLDLDTVGLCSCEWKDVPSDFSLLMAKAFL